MGCAPGAKGAAFRHAAAQQDGGKLLAIPGLQRASSRPQSQPLGQTPCVGLLRWRIQRGSQLVDGRIF